MILRKSTHPEPVERTALFGQRTDCGCEARQIDLTGW